MSTKIEISKRIMAINFASSILRKILSISILLWVFKDLIEGIPESEYSMLPKMTAAMLFFPMATTVFMAGLRRYVTEAYARGDERRVTKLVSSIFPPLLALSGVMLLVGAGLTWKVTDLLSIDASYEGEARLMFGMLMALAALRIGVAPFSLGFHLRQKFLARNLIGLACEVLRIALILWLLHGDKRVLWVVVATAVAGLVELILNVVISMRLAPALRARRGEFDRACMRPMFQFGGWALINNIGFLIRDASDLLILGKLGTDNDVISFQLGAMPDNQSRRIYLEAFGTLQPVMTAMEATGKKEMLKRAYFRLCRYAMWMMCFLAGAIFMLREEALLLYLPEKGEQLGAASTVAALLLARALVIFPNSVIGMLAVAKAEVKAIALRASMMSFCNLGLTLYLVGALQMGAVGSALSTLIITAVGAPLLMWPMGLRMTDSKFSEWLRSSLLPGCVPLLFGIPLWGLALYWLPNDSWPKLCVIGAIGSLGYGVGILLAARQEDRAEFVNILRKLRSFGSKGSV
jgi:O-antigen/teichoic acid export membrane protein